MRVGDGKGQGRQFLRKSAVIPAKSIGGVHALWRLWVCEIRHAIDRSAGFKRECFYRALRGRDLLREASREPAAFILGVWVTRFLETR